MDIFKFNSPTSPTKLEHGEIVDDIKSKMWIERYRGAGEFTFMADPDTGIREKLPIGSLVSHVNTDEVMIVENHAITEARGHQSEITITGRGFETVLEGRVVGSNKTYPNTDGTNDYVQSADETWHQAVLLVSHHILDYMLLDTTNAIPYVDVLTDVTGTGVAEARSFRREDLYSSLLKILEVDNLGTKIIRPSPRSPLAPGSPNIAFLIRKGVDRSSSVTLSYDGGEIDTADYLWSDRRVRNAAMVSGKWVETFVSDSSVEYDRRTLYVDAKDIDEGYQTAPTGTDFDNVVALMNQRGLEELAKQKYITLTKADVHEDYYQSRYREDFELGDIVTVLGSYSESSKMMINEFVEIEDEQGFRGYPTLSLFEEES